MNPIIIMAKDSWAIKNAVVIYHHNKNIIAMMI